MIIPSDELLLWFVIPSDERSEESRDLLFVCTITSQVVNRRSFSRCPPCRSLP